MKKSEQYRMAMKAVLRTNFSEDEKLELLKTLQSDCTAAEWSEERDAQQKAATLDATSAADAVLAGVTIHNATAKEAAE